MTRARAEELLNKIDRAADRNYLSEISLELTLEIHATIAIQLERIANVLEREFGDTDRDVSPSAPHEPGHCRCWVDHQDELDDKDFPTRKELPGSGWS